MRVVVWSPHADDETLGMGGTIAKHVDSGDQVRVLHVAGHRDSQRTVEFFAACSQLGLSGQECGEPWQWTERAEDRYWDGELAHEVPRLVRTMDEFHRRFAPDTVYLPYPSHHPDHRAVYEAGIQSSRVSLNPNHVFPRNVLVYGAVVAELDMYPSGLSWSTFVDISGPHLEKKLAAWRCYESQRQPEPHPGSEGFLVGESIQVGGAVMMAAAERFAPLRSSW